VARQHRLYVVAALALLVLNACGARQGAASQSTATTTTTPPSSTTTTTPPPPAAGGEASPPNQDNRCTAAMLAGTVEPTDSGAGNRYVTLIVRNTSQQPCTLWGYGGLELLNSTRQPIPTNAERNLDPGPTLVTLAPGGEAGKTLHWSVVATGDEPVEGPCQPQAKAINVLPPDETQPFTVDYELGSVCAEGRIETSAYFPR
jgi:Protein of unknown function (DUF4232)